MVRWHDGEVLAASAECDVDAALFEAEDFGRCPSVVAERDGVTGVDELVGGTLDLGKSGSVGERFADGLQECASVEGCMLLGDGGGDRLGVDGRVGDAGWRGTLRMASR